MSEVEHVHQPARTLLRSAADLAIDYATAIDDRQATPTPAAIEALAQLGGDLPDGPSDPAVTIELIARVGGPATMASTGPNYFGFVNGATLPVALRDLVHRRHVGPERSAPRDVAGCGRGARRRSPMAGRSARPDGRHRRHVRHRRDGRDTRLPHGQHATHCSTPRAGTSNVTVCSVHRRSRSSWGPRHTRR